MSVSRSDSFLSESAVVDQEAVQPFLIQKKSMSLAVAAILGYQCGK